MITGERFVRGLADAVPEAFERVDLVDEYDQSAWSPPADRAAGDDGWATTIALADAVRWIEHEALAVNRRRARTAIRPDGEDALRRFFGFIEQVVADAGDEDRGWIMVELFEGIPWVEDVIAFLGPQTVGLLREAQVELARYNGWIGRWTDQPG